MDGAAARSQFEADRAILEALQDREFERTIEPMQAVFGDGNLDKAPSKP